MQLLKSFEESSKDVYGDLLSQRRQRRRISVGLLLFGYFEYWRMFPDSLKHQVESDLSRIEERLRKKYDVISTDMVDTLDAADISGKILRESQVDAVIVVMGTYVPDYITMHALNYVRDAPVLVFSAQHTDCVSDNTTYVDIARDSCMTGTAQLTATFRKIGRKYMTVVGSVNDERAYCKIDSFLKAMQAIQDVKEANIGVLGNVFRGMYDIELSKTFLKGVFDVNVIYIQETHLVEEWEEITQKDTEALAEVLLKRFKSRSVSREDILRACRLALAIEKLVDKYRLDALCMLDQHYLQRLFRTTSRIGASLLLEKHNIPVCLEGDLGSLVVAMMLQSLTGKNPMQGGWCGYDEDLNTCLIGGHGVADPQMAGSDDKVILTPTPEAWGLDGRGLNYEFIVKPGVCTVSSLLETSTGYSIMISGGQSIEHKPLNNDELCSFLKVDRPVKQYLEQLFQYGVTQHCMLCHGDVRTELELVADYLGLDRMIL